MVTRHTAATRISSPRWRTRRSRSGCVDPLSATSAPALPMVPRRRPEPRQADQANRVSTAAQLRPAPRRCCEARGCSKHRRWVLTQVPRLRGRLWITLLNAAPAGRNRFHPAGEITRTICGHGHEQVCERASGARRWTRASRPSRAFPVPLLRPLPWRQGSVNSAVDAAP